jgi:hypothetical protein
MNWVISTTRDGHYYNPETHEVRAKKGWLKEQIAGKKDLIKRMTTRMTEIIGDIEKEIEELERQLEEP